jgi:blue copper oxidase
MKASLLEPDAHGQYTLTAMTGSSQWNGKSVPTWGYKRAGCTEGGGQLEKMTTLHIHILIVNRGTA